MNLNLSYTYTDVENLDSDSLDTSIYKGKRMADVPMHQYVADLRFSFITQTALNIFGEYTANSIQYVMKSNPGGTVSSSDQTTAAFKSVRLHDSVMFNIKLSQKFLEHYEGYILCRNIFDDYAVDPFNPGPGRQFYAGLRAEL